MSETVDIEEMVLGLFDLGEIGYVNPPGPEVAVSNPDYPEEVFRVLRSGRLSPDYVNLRWITSYSKGLPVPVERQKRTRDLVISAYGQLLDQQEYDHLLGIPQALTCLSGMIGYSRGESVLWLRTGNKTYGIHHAVEGHYAEGERVVTNDNVISDGASKLELVEPLTGEGLAIAGFNVLVDREEGGMEAVEAAGYNFAAVVGMRAVTEILFDAGRISSQQREWSIEYRNRIGR